MNEGIHPRCDRCEVAYVIGYEGPCQEYAQSATDKQIVSGEARKCGGSVSLVATLARDVATLNRKLGELQGTAARG